MQQKGVPGIDFRAQKAELEAVLASRIFARAPSLSKILSYICQKYFEGDTDSIKEYNIAVEALGRGADFQPSSDSIVRAEFSRLRKRLQEYYRTEGKDRPFELQVPQSGYAPRFVAREIAAAPQASFGPRRNTLASFRSAALVLLVLLLIAAAALAWYRSIAGARDAAVPDPARPGVSSAETDRRSSERPNPAAPEASSAVAGSEEAIRIAVGSSLPKYVDASGQTWLADQWFEGGTPVDRRDRHIWGTFDPYLYQTARQGRFQYKIPLKAGEYELHLHFAEILLGMNSLESSGEGARRIDITLNGEPLLSGLDIVSDAGGASTVDEKIFTGISPAGDGFLYLGFAPFRDVALLNGIEILPANGGKMHPIRIVTGSRRHYDPGGVFWGADRYFRGGTIAKRWPPIQATDPSLYATERWGHFVYSIPVAKGGTYTLTLKFAESYFASSNALPGARLFDVFCNGVALLRNFDIVKEAGKTNRALDKVFRGLKPNAQDKLVVSFVPVKDYAIVNAIEVVQE